MSHPTPSHSTTWEQSHTDLVELLARRGNSFFSFLEECQEGLEELFDLDYCTDRWHEHDEQG